MVVQAAMVESYPRGRNLSLTPKERRKLRQILRNREVPEAKRRRAQIIIRAAQARANFEIAQDLGLSVAFVDRVRERFARRRLAGLEEEPKRPVLVVPAEDEPRRAVRIDLLHAERRALRRIVSAHKSEQRLVLRASIVLLAREGRNNCEIADELGCDVKTVRKWRARFAQDRVDGLCDLPRSGRPRTFEASQRHEAIATVLGSPPAPYACWTLELAVAALIERGIVSSISRETISRWLRTADIKPHRCRYWLNSKDPDFRKKMEQVVNYYVNPPRYGRVICVDEKTCIPARERKHPDHPTRAGRVRQAEFEYKRHGVVNLIAAFEVHTGRVVAQCVDKNDSKAFIRFLKHLRAQYPREKLYLILDNGTTHHSKATAEFLAKHPRLVPVYTPTHASWLNQIEIWFSALTRQALRRVSFRSREELIQRIHHYVEVHNQDPKTYRWTWTGDPLRA